jgi:uncharacterized YkwD family protein
VRLHLLFFRWVKIRKFPPILFKKTTKIRKQEHLLKEVFTMIKKTAGSLLIAVMMLGLVACNNNDNAATRDNNLGTNTLDRTNNNQPLRVGNGRDDGIDHNGPLTEDYTNNGNSEPDFDANLYNTTDDNRRRNTATGDYTTRNTATRNGTTGNITPQDTGTRDHTTRNTGTQNTAKRNNKNNDEDDLNISSYYTNINSSQYPHTKAVLIRDAKYQFIRIDPRQGFRYQAGAPQQAQPPAEQQQPTEKAPVQQPAPQQAQPPAQQQQQQPAEKAPAQQPAQKTAPATGDVSKFVQQVIDLTNAQRSKNGLPALKADSQLNGVAQKKSVDMQQNNYFSHTSPTYGSPFDMMRDFGVTYKSAGENIAKGQRTPQEVVTAWMNSEGHRKNILSKNFTHIGVGFEKTGNHWTQMFIGK